MIYLAHFTHTHTHESYRDLLISVIIKFLKLEWTAGKREPSHLFNYMCNIQQQ